MTPNANPALCLQDVQSGNFMLTHLPSKMVIVCQHCVCSWFPLPPSGQKKQVYSKNTKHLLVPKKKK